MAVQFLVMLSSASPDTTSLFGMTLRQRRAFSFHKLQFFLLNSFPGVPPVLSLGFDFVSFSGVGDNISWSVLHQQPSMFAKDNAKALKYSTMLASRLKGVECHAVIAPHALPIPQSSGSSCTNNSQQALAHLIVRICSTASFGHNLQLGMRGAWATHWICPRWFDETSCVHGIVFCCLVCFSACRTPLITHFHRTPLLRQPLHRQPRRFVACSFRRNSTETCCVAQIFEDSLFEVSLVSAH